MTSLAPADRDVLARLEAVIERASIDAAAALRRVRDERLYRAEHATFEDYCRERWGYNKRYVNRMIAAASVVENLGPMGPKPATERVARPLAALPAEKQPEAWARAVETSPNGKPTSKHVAEVVRSMGDSRTERPERQGRSPAINVNDVLLSSISALETTVYALYRVQPQIADVDPETIKRFCKVRARFTRFVRLLGGENA